MSRDTVLWSPILVPPVVWFFCMWANFALAPWACAFGWKFVMIIVSAVGLAIAAALSLTGFNEWKSLRSEWPGDAGGAIPRARIMAVLGMLIAAMAFLVILAQLVPVLMMERASKGKAHRRSRSLPAPACCGAPRRSPPAPRSLSAWEFDPGVAIPPTLSALLYLRGARVSRGTTRFEQLLFWSGWTSLFIALVSPLHPLGEALFSAHMAQHEILMLISAPLFVLSRPMPAILCVGHADRMAACARPMDAREPISGPLARHHAALLGMVHPRHRAVDVARSGFVRFHTSILGALLTFSPVIWYLPYATATRAWGLTPLEDQQLGGLIMWVPASLVYIATGLALFSKWLRASEEMVLRSSGAD